MSTFLNIKDLNTFAIHAQCGQLHQPKSIGDLIELANVLPDSFYILGEGSNTLFVDKFTPPIIKPQLLGIQIESFDDHYCVTAAASENWHQLVEHCIERCVYGLENLALIPGSVGAAPVQNIGAYGVELADYCTEVSWFSFVEKREIKLQPCECKFGYRDSVFKHELKNKGIITSITLKLPKQWQAKLDYAGLNELSPDACAKQVLDKVIAIRQAKLPDPNVTPNAGSFFKNPIVKRTTLTLLMQQHPNVPHYPVDEQHVKLAAGWLIEQAGLKGYQQDGVGVHSKQALVLVNHHSQVGTSLLNLAHLVVNKVKQQFNVELEPEVRLVSVQGEKSYQELITHG